MRVSMLLGNNFVPMVIYKLSIILFFLVELIIRINISKNRYNLVQLMLIKKKICIKKAN